MCDMLPRQGQQEGKHSVTRAKPCMLSAVRLALQVASTTTSDPYMAMVDEMIDKGSDFSFRGTDDELDTRSAVEASLGYEDLGAAEQDMRIRCACMPNDCFLHHYIILMHTSQVDGLLRHTPADMQPDAGTLHALKVKALPRGE